MKLVERIITICSLIGIVFAVYHYNENRYAYAKDLESLEQRLEYKIQSDQLNSLRQRYWQMEERIDKKPKDEDAKKEAKELKEQIEEIKENIRILKEK